jgi:hypothetical protein
MIQPLGDKIFSWLLYIFVAFWGLGWIFMLLIKLIQKIFPKLEEKSEKLLKTSENILGVIMKYSLISAGILLLIQLMGIVAKWLGW